MDELNALMGKYIDFKQKVKDYKALVEQVRTEIMILIKTEEITEYEDDDCKLQLTTNKRKTFDKDKAIIFITEHEGDANTFFQESDYETLKVKAKGGGTE